LKRIRNGKGEKMTIETISDIVKRLKRRYAEEDPERLCRAMGIRIQRIPMGRKQTACKGFFIRKFRIPLIVLNADLPSRVQRIILIHELGNAALHSGIPTECAFHDFELFDETSVYEYEANIFAAEFLLEDEAVLEQLNEDTSFFNAARTLCVPPELLDFKFRVLKRRGYSLNPPLYARSCFMKDIDRPDRF
jgi:Zn-dependent peptidase ImmA (M78 family)